MAIPAKTSKGFGMVENTAARTGTICPGQSLNKIPHHMALSLLNPADCVTTVYFAHRMKISAAQLVVFVYYYELEMLAGSESNGTTSSRDETDSGDDEQFSDDEGHSDEEEEAYSEILSDDEASSSNGSESNQSRLIGVAYENYNRDILEILPEDHQDSGSDDAHFGSSREGDEPAMKQGGDYGNFVQQQWELYENPWEEGHPPSSTNS
ncbi:hypothetical protein NW762_013038 [Fusarium torreyae]|uniref:Uncharacterized protein n=1 Tax=Fusarium torreyae TaxID=1237075 RepID=A0A9W8RPI5_9HYPO|nr:hypothetical protein NW762_013038 [Fusarium torreyae]